MKRHALGLRGGTGLSLAFCHRSPLPLLCGCIGNPPNSARSIAQRKMPCRRFSRSRRPHRPHRPCKPAAVRRARHRRPRPSASSSAPIFLTSTSRRGLPRPDGAGARGIERPAGRIISSATNARRRDELLERKRTPERLTSRLTRGGSHAARGDPAKRGGSAGRRDAAAAVRPPCVPAAAPGDGCVLARMASACPDDAMESSPFAVAIVPFHLIGARERLADPARDVDAGRRHERPPASSAMP